MSDFIPVCDLCDRHQHETDGAFRILPPLFRPFAGAARFRGPISTVRCFEDNALIKAALDSPGQGRVLVVDGGASMRRAVLGGNLGAAAARNGWAGVLVNGCVRDSAELQVLPIGILALATMPLPPRKEGLGARDVDVLIQGVWVRPGEWLAADEDGVVVYTDALA